MTYAWAIAFRDWISVGQEHRKAHAVGAEAHLVAAEHVRAIGEPGDPSESFRLALGAQQPARGVQPHQLRVRSEEHTSELQSLMRISYAVFCLKKKRNSLNNKHRTGAEYKVRSKPYMHATTSKKRESAL